MAEGNGKLAEVAGGGARVPSPPKEACLRFFSPRAPSFSLRFLTLAALLEYTPAPAAEHVEESFELALCAESLWEVLARDACHILAAALLLRQGEESTSGGGGDALQAPTPSEEGAGAGGEASPPRDAKRPRLAVVPDTAPLAVAASAARSSSGGEGGEELQLRQGAVAQAFALFDRLGTGQMGIRDLEGLLCNGIPRLSRRAVGGLVGRASGEAGAVRLQALQKCIPK